MFYCLFVKKKEVSIIQKPKAFLCRSVPHQSYQTNAPRGCSLGRTLSRKTNLRLARGCVSLREGAVHLYFPHGTASLRLVLRPNLSRFRGFLVPLARNTIRCIRVSNFYLTIPLCISFSLQTHSISIAPPSTLHGTKIFSTRV